MKNILIILLLVSNSLFGQQSLFVYDTSATTMVTGLTTGALFSTGSIENYFNGKVSYRYDTSILYKGNSNNCEHRFVERKTAFDGRVCGVSHGAIGCPDRWYKNNSICTKCLKHVHVKETRSIIKEVDEYEEALQKLNNLKSQ